MSSQRHTFQILVALLFVAGAGALLFAERTLPMAGPVSAVRFHANALEQGNLANLEESSTQAVFLGYQTQASRPAFREAWSLFNERIPRIGRPIWQQVRNAARMEAANEYEALREKVLSLGRIRYQQLSAGERTRIIETGTFNQFVFEAGVEQLSGEERERVPDANAFLRRLDRGSYLDRESWRHLPPGEAARLESPLALAEEDTIEKLQYFDRAAASRLTEADRGLLALVDRADVQSLESFVAVHGKRLLGERLAQHTLRVAGVDQLECSSPAFERGSLLAGPVTVCRTNGDQAAFGLTRVTLRWLVHEVNGVSAEPER